eukprot:jgi/Galph1/5732/GphlegSOOS_G4408.1
MKLISLFIFASIFYVVTAEYQLVVSVYDNATCTGTLYGTWTYTSNTTCFAVVQPPVPTMYEISMEKFAQTVQAVESAVGNTMKTHVTVLIS